MNLNIDFLDSFMIAWEMDKEIALEYLVACLLEEIDPNLASQWIKYTENR